MYDVENRLVSASVNSSTVTLTYDPLGRLFQVTGGSGTRQLLYDGDQLVAEYNGATGALLRRYVQGPSGDDPLIWYEGAAVSSATRRSLQTDYQGSIQSVADSSGKVLGINRYDEYGVPATENLGTFQYTGQAWVPEIGLYYYKARMYNPRLGRFMQTDPIGYKDDLDLYAYVGDDPMDETDPSGECIEVRCMGNPLLLDSAKATTKQQLPQVTITATGYAKVYDPPLREVHPETLLIPGSALAKGALNSAAIIAIVGNIFKPKGEGIETASGSRVTGFTRHGVNRAIGDAAKRAGTKPKAILDALRNPTKPVVRGVDSQGRPFEIFTGKDARVVINPDTGNVVSVNPLSGAGAN